MCRGSGVGVCTKEVKIVVGVLSSWCELPIANWVFFLLGTSTVELGRGVPIGLRFRSTNEQKPAFHYWLEVMFVLQHASVVERALLFVGDGTSTT